MERYVWLESRSALLVVYLVLGTNIKVSKKKKKTSNLGKADLDNLCHYELSGSFFISLKNQIYTKKIDANNSSSYQKFNMIL